MSALKSWATKGFKKDGKSLIGREGRWFRECSILGVLSLDYIECGAHVLKHGQGRCFCLCTYVCKYILACIVCMYICLVLVPPYVIMKCVMTKVQSICMVCTCTSTSVINIEALVMESAIKPTPLISKT